MQSISVCMATYNGEKYIYEQTKSILAQLSPADELIVSDDGSTDGTIEILQSFEDKRIKILYNKGAKGPNGNFQNGLMHVSGDFIFLADQDDVWFENKIEVMHGFLQTYDVVNCDCSVVDEDLNILEKSFFKHRTSGAGFIKNLKGNTYMGNSMAFKRELLKLILPFPPNIPNHDLWIGVVADLFYKPYFIPQILGLHRRHSSNASNTFDVKVKTSFWQKVNKRILVFRNLPKLLHRRFSN